MLYVPPAQGQLVLELDPYKRSTRLVGTILGDAGDAKYIAPFVLVPSNMKLYSPPYGKGATHIIELTTCSTPGSACLSDAARGSLDVIFLDFPDVEDDGDSLGELYSPSLYRLARSRLAPDPAI